ncbi:AMP-binding protein [Nocardioides sp. R-C-SC26]|uniref:AMP-dependent synthetase/ligase n=1 Tax=Nocardioides sp. R-C-SC26 TaxID=2870414 RepID=UPI0027E14200|nr:AMP-binding protein [Nocardioides sp. R-C-SC26]
MASPTWTQCAGWRARLMSEENAVREYSTPLTTSISSITGSGNLTDDVVRNARQAPDAVVLARREDGAWLDVTAAQFHEQVVAVAGGLMAAGIEPGDRVGLISSTRYEWTLLDYAIWFAGAVTVPVYETSSADQIAWILRDSGAKAAVVEHDLHRSRIEEHRDDQPALEHLWCIDDGAVDDLVALGSRGGSESAGHPVTADQVEERRRRATPESPATIIYTSGTTGRPKGCVLTHGNFMVELGVAVPELAALFGTPPDGVGRVAGSADGGEEPATLLFLPLAHVFARIIQIGSIKARVRLGHSSDIRTLTTTLESFQPTFVLAVPRVFEKLFNTASQRATADGRGRLFERAAETAISYSRASEPGSKRGRPGVALRAQHAVFDRLVYTRLREVLGGRCTYAISGGAPLGERLGHFYRGIGVTVLEGYGLTETTGALTVNLPEAQKVGTVGRPLPGTAVRIADDGELLVRGGQVFSSYWNDPEATAEALTAGWLHTGDVGEIDDEGFVRITGRKKEILVTAGGKNVAPAALEDRLRAHPLVSQALVVGDRRPFIAALLTLDEDAFDAWREGRGKKGGIADLVRDPDLLAVLQEAVDEANSAVSRAEAIRRFEVLPRDWTEEDGHLTPSLKLKRNVVLRDFRDEITALYL